MERIQPMNELEIREKVEDLAGGKSAKILDCEQNTMNQTEEVLLVNGVVISLKGEEGARIKEALIHGEVPPCDIVNSMLTRAGIETSAVEVETMSSVKSSTKTLEHSTLVDSHGVLVDEKMREKEDEDEFKTHNVEIWMAEHQATSGTNQSSFNHNKSQKQQHQQQQSPPPSANNPIDKSHHHNNKNNSSANTNNKSKSKKGSKNSGKDKEETPEKKPNKKSIFSPSSIIRGSSNNKTDKTNDSKSDKNDKKSDKDKSIKEQQQQQQQLQQKSVQNVQNSTKSPQPQQQSPLDNSSKSIVSSESPLPSSNVPKNKFLALFSKGKSKDKDKVVDANLLQSDGSSKHKKQNKNIMGDKQQQQNLKNSHNNQYKSGVEKKKDSGDYETKKQNLNVNYLDPSLSLVRVEIDGIPVRVTYETFV